jgi:hypothetical protein
MVNRRKCFLKPFPAFYSRQAEMGNDPGKERNSQVNEYALRDFTHSDIHHRTLKPEQWGQNRNENVAVN